MQPKNQTQFCSFLLDFYECPYFRNPLNDYLKMYFVVSFHFEMLFGQISVDLLNFQPTISTTLPNCFVFC